MKFLLPTLFCFLLFFTSSLHAQEEYTVDGQVYILKTEVKGDLELLWNVIDRRYRYFLKRGDYITELKNTRINGRYQQDYKRVLQEQTSDVVISTKKVNLTLPSLHSFFAEYNTLKDSGFSEVNNDVPLQLWLGAYGGITNSVYTSNITNESQYVAGLELELVDTVKLRRHSMVLDFRHTFEGDEHKYSISQLALNYRFKFIKSKKFDMYLNTRFVALSFYEKEAYYDDSTDIVDESGSDFSSPLSFGIGMDYMVGKGYITFGYHDIVAVNMDSNKESPIDFSLGYKFHL